LKEWKQVAIRSSNKKGEEDIHIAITSVAGPSIDINRAVRNVIRRMTLGVTSVPVVGNAYGHGDRTC